MLYYIGLAITLIAFLSSLVSFRLDFPVHLKFFSILLGVTALNEIGAWFIPAVLHKKNIAWYNVFMGVEFFMYGYYFYILTQRETIKKIIKSYLIVFPIFWYAVVFFVFGINEWNSYLAIAGSLAVVCFSVCFYYEIFKAPELVRLGTSTEFWIATALILFYSCNMPYVGMLNFLVKNYLPLAAKVISSFQILYIVTYCMFIYAFIRRSIQ